MANMNMERSTMSFIKFTNLVALTKGTAYPLRSSNFQIVSEKYASSEVEFSTSFYFEKPKLVQIFTNSNLDFKCSIITDIVNSTNYTTPVYLRCDTVNKGDRLYAVLNTLFINRIYEIRPKSNYDPKNAYFTITW